MALPLWYYRTVSAISAIGAIAYILAIVAMASNSWINTGTGVRFGLYIYCVGLGTELTCESLFNDFTEITYIIVSLALLSVCFLMSGIGMCTYSFTPVSTAFLIIGGSFSLGAALNFRNGAINVSGYNESDLSWGYQTALASGILFIIMGCVLIGLSASQSCTMTPLSKNNVTGHQRNTVVVPVMTSGPQGKYPGQYPGQYPMTPGYPSYPGQPVYPGGQMGNPGQMVDPGGMMVSPGGQIMNPGGHIISPGGQMLNPGVHGDPVYPPYQGSGSEFPKKSRSRRGSGSSSSSNSSHG